MVIYPLALIADVATDVCHPCWLHKRANGFRRAVLMAS